MRGDGRGEKMSCIGLCANICVYTLILNNIGPQRVAFLCDGKGMSFSPNFVTLRVGSCKFYTAEGRSFLASRDIHFPVEQLPVVGNGCAAKVFCCRIGFGAKVGGSS